MRFLSRLKNKILSAVESVTTLGAKPSTLLNRQRDKLKQNFADNIRMANVRESKLSTVLSGIRDFMTTAKRNAKTVVRTAANAAANTAREAIIEANPDQFRGYIHLSVFDSRTSDICISRASLKWDMNKKPVGHNRPFALPPLHPNCRSKLIPWVKGAKATDLPKSFNQWLKGQSKEIQVETLGVSKQKLWKNGKLSLRKLVDQSGRPLTLQEIRDRKK